jgi:hypothetical protein
MLDASNENNGSFVQAMPGARALVVLSWYVRYVRPTVPSLENVLVRPVRIYVRIKLRRGAKKFGAKTKNFPTLERTGGTDCTVRGMRENLHYIRARVG